MSGAEMGPAPSTADKIASAGRGLLAIALVVAVLIGVRKMGWGGEPVGAIFALGFLLVGGIVGGRVVGLLGMPRLTGYLAVGVLAGPSGFEVFNRTEVASLELINELALALIALQAGAELTLPMLKRGLKSFVLASASHSVVIAGGMALLFLGLSSYIDFTKDLPLGARFALGCVWGAMAVSKAPADTLAILGETKSKGPLAEHALGVVVLLDVLVLVLFAGAMMVGRTAFDPSASISLHEVTDLGMEIFSSIAAGTAFGLGIAFFFWAVKREKLLFTIVVAYGVTAFCQYFHYDTLLVFVVAGFVVMNLTRVGPQLLHTTESAGSAVMVVFFATAGAGLDLSALQRTWPIALALAFGRVFFTWLACQIGHRLADDPTPVRRYAFTSFISQAGVTIGLASIAAASLGPAGKEMKALVIAVIGINELMGPLMFKFGLSKAGEIGKANEADADEPGADAHAHAESDDDQDERKVSPREIGMSITPAEEFDDDDEAPLKPSPPGAVTPPPPLKHDVDKPKG